MPHSEIQLKELEEKIRELEIANQKLRLLEENHSLSFKHLMDIIYIINRDLNLVSISPSVEKMLGYKPQDLIGRPVSSLEYVFMPESFAQIMADTESILKGNIIPVTIYQFIAKDGNIKSGEVSLSRIMRDDKIVGVISIARDITERREIENRQAKSRQELESTKISEGDAREYAESIINTVRESLIVLDQDLRIVTGSRSFYEVFKVKPEETVGQLIYDLGNKQWDIPMLRELLETILPQKTTFDNYEVEHDFATIGKRIMLLNARQIQRVLGKERIILLAIEDITERREIENGLKTAHEELKMLATELEHTARVKSEFLANMSHELRTPLNSINGFSEVLYDELFGSLNEKQKKYVNNILTSGKHLLLLINQILDMAKVEAGKMSLALSNLPMKILLNEIALLVTDMVSKKKIKLLLDIAEDLPSIEADELKVKEIIYNLLSNAVKFTPEGGKIGMRAKRIDSEIEIVVWDTGIGIAPEYMGKIFEGFFRVDTPYSRVTEGTGLGLPLSRKLVELHGGKFSVASDGVNKGTLTRFTLPIISSKVVKDEEESISS